MKRVKVYTVKEEYRTVYPAQDYFEMNRASYTSSPPLVYFDNEAGVQMAMEVEVESLPIKYYRWADGRSIHAAMSTELRELLDIEVDEMERLRSCNRTVERECHRLEKELDSCIQQVYYYTSMSLWERIKWAFRRK